MSVFADSSALVKRYADEPGADEVRALPLLVVCALARVEVPAALWRKVRTGQLSAPDAAVQLASALAVRSADAEVDGFACFDTGLRAAAAAEGLDLVV